MANIPLAKLRTFDSEFRHNAPEDIARRAILREMAQTGAPMSFYEARTIRRSELIAMAVEIERNPDEKSRNLPVGRTADGWIMGTGQTVYHLGYGGRAPQAETGDIRELTIRCISEYGYLFELESKMQSLIVVPTRMVFQSRDTIMFMKQELDAYAATPSVRRLGDTK